MNKFKNYIFAFLIILFGTILVTNNFVNAEEINEEPEVEEDPNLDKEDAFVVINPTSNNEASYKYDDVQYTKSRDVSIKLLIDDNELDNYDSKFDICEVIKHVTVTNTGKENVDTKEKCSFYVIEDGEVTYQVSSENDGKKTIKLYFYTKGNYGKKEAVSREIVKEIVLDTTGPVITLTNGEYIFIPKGKKYEEYKATCEDDSGVLLSECKVNVETANIDLNKKGYQYVRYTATDFLGNETNALRKVLVDTTPEEKSNTMYWVFAGGGVFILSLGLAVVVIKNKEKQRNQSVL